MCYQSQGTSSFVILSGCSGGGKTTLLSELQRHGFAVIDEPGQRIVSEEVSSGRCYSVEKHGRFLRRAIMLSVNNYTQARDHEPSWVFFDRVLIDAAAAFQAVTGEAVLTTLMSRYRYHSRVFLVLPWPEIYEQNTDRRYSMEAEIAEFERLQDVYPALGYAVSLLPKVSVKERADFVLLTLGYADVLMTGIFSMH
ncbi:MAG: AAA family ATPase [Candidatus Malihini olakiniferum]